MSNTLENILKAAKNRFNTIYSGIFGEISSMLKLAKLCPIHELQSRDPSFMKLLDELKQYHKIVIELNTIFAFSSEIDVSRLGEYINVVENLAKAIDSGDLDDLTQAIAQLDEKPYI